MWDPNPSPMQVSDVLRQAALLIEICGHHKGGPGNLHDGYDIHRAIVIACDRDSTTYDMSIACLSRFLGTQFVARWGDSHTSEQVQDALIRAAGGWYD